MHSTLKTIICSHCLATNSNSQQLSHALAALLMAASASGLEGLMSQFRALAVALAPEARRQMEETIRQVADRAVVQHYANADCEVCMEPLAIPVELHLKCAGTSLRICLRCTRTHFQLNTEQSRRTSVRHIKCCQQRVDTRNLNARRVYTIQYDFMRILDQDVPITCECTCGAKFSAEDGESRIKYHAHMGDGTCPLSTWTCPFCNDRVKGFAMIKHITKSSVEGGCMYRDDLVSHARNQLQLYGTRGNR